MKSIKIFRIENPNTKAGMWYNIDGEYDPFIMTLTEGVSKNLPMGKHPRYRNGGRAWFSGCVDINSLKGWFSKKDAEELLAAGYEIVIFEATEYRIEEHQVIFTRESILSQESISIDQFWGL